jgi:hypothetical protein
VRSGLGETALQTAVLRLDGFDVFKPNGPDLLSSIDAASRAAILATLLSIRCDLG